MNILVTGGAGFIGSHLCDALIEERDANIVVVDNLSLGRKENIQHLFARRNFAFHTIDIAKEEGKLSDIFKNNAFDVVFHLAANSDIGQSFHNPYRDMDNTFLTTFQLLNQMRIHKVSQIVFASTSAIYGDVSQELTEEYGPLFPVSHYGAGKLASEGFISSFTENYSLQSWIVRFPNVVGERATHGIIFDFLKKIKENPHYLEVLGDGEQNKPYVYVKDLVEAIIFVWKNSTEKLNYFNIGVEDSTKVRDIARIILEETKEVREIRYTGGSRGWVGDVPFFAYNLDKIHGLGWRAKYTSNEAVRLAVQKNIEKR
ncbi:MAG: GDP-mannose 4,6-dehydratase [Chitinophagaceae bacterium]|nr:GDP-mannose 4,6-dehydratase [Chitinophagaceae bacterium]